MHRTGHENIRTLKTKAMAFSPSRRKLVNAKATKAYLEAFFDAARLPSRFVQTRESTQTAISDTYNGDGKVYAALRAAAYVSWGIVTSLGAPSETGLRA